MYSRWSPHKFVQNFNTPILIIHGELDYRVPIGEGMQLFTAVQRKGIDSKILIFPDEGHWVLKPQNSQLWFNTVLDWLDKYLQTNFDILSSANSYTARSFHELSTNAEDQS